ncbi:hypothetical protein N7451_001702 [Penicillium sp. IBT 35674x]|nr:hypothetical protein N7451_001702 [Penicillium sp. IBT 35674x]
MFLNILSEPLSALIPITIAHPALAGNSPSAGELDSSNGYKELGNTDLGAIWEQSQTGHIGSQHDLDENSGDPEHSCGSGGKGGGGGSSWSGAVMTKTILDCPAKTVTDTLTEKIIDCATTTTDVTTVTEAGLTVTETTTTTSVGPTVTSTVTTGASTVTEPGSRVTETKTQTEKVTDHEADTITNHQGITETTIATNTDALEVTITVTSDDCSDTGTSGGGLDYGICSILYECGLDGRTDYSYTTRNHDDFPSGSTTDIYSPEDLSATVSRAPAMHPRPLLTSAMQLKRPPPV